MCDDDLSSVYRKKNRYETGTVSKTQNVYYGPSGDTDVIGVVTPKEEIEIDNEESKGQYYKVFTEGGLVGFVRIKNVKIVG